MPTITDTPTISVGDLFTWGSGTVWFRATEIGPSRITAVEVGNSDESGGGDVVLYDEPGSTRRLYRDDLLDLVVRPALPAPGAEVDDDADPVQLRAEIALLTERLMSAVNSGEFPGYDRFLDAIEDQLSAITLPERQIVQTYNLNVRVTITGHPDRIHTAAIAAAEAIGRFEPTEHNQCQVETSHYATALLVS